MKRVVIGGLQGVDYLYTAQGWLKSINGITQTGDPGQDTPGTTGMLPDLFGQELEYFAGDYASSRQTGRFTTSSNSPERFDGTLRALAWRTPSHPGMHGYGYRYDERGQLNQADYGQPVLASGSQNISFTADPSRRYAEGNLTYDPNGNLISLQRTDRLGQYLMNIGYQYLGNTNKLQKVNSQVPTVPGIDYIYDELGQMTAQVEAGATKYLDYDVSGKVTAVYRTADKSTPLAQYVYDEFGQRIQQTVFDSRGVADVTLYVRDAGGNEVASYYYDPATPNQPRLAEQPIYGSSRIGVVRQPRGSDAADQLYELNDQLGNTRVVFHAPRTTTNVLTMEDGRIAQEQQNFDTPFNAPNTTTFSQIRSSSYSRKASPYGQNYSMYVVNRVGPGKKLAVAPGDRVLVEVYAGYPQSGVIAGIASPKASLFMAGAGATLLAQPPRPAVEATAPATAGWQRALGQLSLGVSIPLFSKQAAATKSAAAPLATPPNASLRYILRLVRDQSVVRSGTMAVSSAAEGQWQLLSFDVQVDTEEPAQLEVWVQSDDSREMYFDDLRIENQAGPIVQENHFYAYGQRNDGLSWTRQYQRPYGRGYQGQDTRFDTETGYDNFELRLYDSRIGRWLSTDPMGQHFSPYLAMGNDPVNRDDPDGGLDTYRLFSDGTTSVTKTNDNFNTYYYIDIENGASATYLGTLDKGASNLVDFWNYGSGFMRYGPEDLAKQGGSYGKGDHWIDSYAAGALLASAWEWQGRFNSKGATPLQFGDMSGSDGITPNTSHIGGHNGGRNIDVRYPRKDFKTLPVTVNDSQFDKNESIRLVNTFHKWGFKSILSFPNSNGYLLEGTKQYKGHDNHLHLQGFTPNIRH